MAVFVLTCLSSYCRPGELLSVRRCGWPTWSCLTRKGSHQASTKFPAGIAGEIRLLHRLHNTVVDQTIASDRQVTPMAVPSPSPAILPRPTGRSTIQVDQMKLTPITMLIIRQKAGQNTLRIRTLLQAFKTTDPQIGIGVGLGRHSANSGADVGHGGSNGQMTGGNSHAKAAVAGITGQDRKGHGSWRSSRSSVSKSTAVPAQHCSSLVNSAAE